MASYNCDEDWGKRLWLIRILLGYSQEQASNAAGLPASTYAQYENKNRRPHQFSVPDRFAQLFKVDTRTLTEGKPISGVALLYPRKFEPRQTKEIREQIKVILPGLLGKIDSCVELLLKDGACFVINQRICFVVGEDLQIAVQSLAPGRTSVPMSAELAISVESFLPKHVEVLVSRGILTKEAGKIISRRLAGIILQNTTPLFEWIEPVRLSLSGIQDDALRLSTAEALVGNLYKGIDQELAHWVANEIAFGAEIED